MAKLKLTLACDSYDYLQPLREGKIEPEGIDLNLVTVESGIRHERFYHYGEYDACEFSMCSYLVARGHGIDWFEAVPFFTRRMFGHKFCFVRHNSDAKKPADLKGARFGIRTYENTLAFMVKGMFMHDYDLSVDQVTWVCVNRELVGAKLPASIKVEHVEGKRRLEDLLAAGEIDAEVEPDLPRGWLGGESKVQRLFPDFEEAERAYYRNSRIFPIMHPLVVKKEILERDPWVATSLYEAFCAARNVYNDFMQQPHRLSFAWARAYLEKEREFFGGDPFPQGIKKNQHDLESMLEFAREQHLTPKPLTVQELFTENTRNT
jgi:4,5-dihydroxyphthalate decarboxylase